MLWVGELNLGSDDDDINYQNATTDDSHDDAKESKCY